MVHTGEHGDIVADIDGTATVATEHVGAKAAAELLDVDPLARFAGFVDRPNDPEIL
jgi:hypothetical protein